MYNLTSSTGTIVVADTVSIEYKGLELIGKDSPHWNEPIQQNFVKLIDAVQDNTQALDNLPVATQAEYDALLVEIGL